MMPITRMASTSRGVRLRLSCADEVVIHPTLADQPTESIGDHPGMNPATQWSMPNAENRLSVTPPQTPGTARTLRPTSDFFDHHDGAPVQGQRLTRADGGSHRVIGTGRERDLAV